MDVIVDLDKNSIALLQTFCAQNRMDPATVLNELIKMYCGQQVRRVQHQQPTGYVQGLDPVDPIQDTYPQNQDIPPRRQVKLHRDNPAVPRGTKAQATVIRQKSKTIPKKTAQRMR